LEDFNLLVSPLKKTQYKSPNCLVLMAISQFHTQILCIHTSGGEATFPMAALPVEIHKPSHSTCCREITNYSTEDTLTHASGHKKGNTSCAGAQIMRVIFTYSKVLKGWH
jgi:hypothetical protein